MSGIVSEVLADDLERPELVTHSSAPEDGNTSSLDPPHRLGQRGSDGQVVVHRGGLNDAARDDLLASPQVMHEVDGGVMLR